MWGKQAENLHKYQKKGNNIAINGTLRTNSYVDKENKKRVQYYVLVDTIEFLENKKNTTENGQKENIEEKSPVISNPFEEFAEETQMELPFYE